MNRFTRALAAWLAALAITALTACGGGGAEAPGGGTDGTGSPAQFMEGVMTRGSVIVNGVRFDDSSAVVRIDDRSGTAAELANGMVVKLRGRVNADGTTGVAERIEVENEVRGAIAGVNSGANPPSFVVAGQTVLVDSSTVYANVSGLAGLTVGVRVEVHGLRDAAGNLRASRVEVTPNAVDELKGIVANLAGSTFTLSGVTVNFASATITPAGGSVANGRPVEVHGSFAIAGGVFNATRVDLEDLEDAQVIAGNGARLEVEGFVTGLNTSASTFVVNGRTVRYSAATRFERGTAADLANSVKVEAEGAVDAAGVLVATKIQFKENRVILQGLATAVDLAQRRVTLFGQVVRIDDLTEIRAVNAARQQTNNLADITAGLDRIEVRARVDAGGTIIAERLRETDDRDDELRGRVTAKNETARTLTVLGVNVSLANAQFRDRNDAAMTAAAFFAAITPASATAAGTEVQVKGVFAGGVLTAAEAELED